MVFSNEFFKSYEEYHVLKELDCIFNFFGKVKFTKYKLNTNQRYLKLGDFPVLIHIYKYLYSKYIIIID